MSNSTDNLALFPYGKGGREVFLPVDGGSHIRAGTMVAQLKATAMLVPGSTAGAGHCVGVSTHETDNTDGSDGDLRNKILTDQIFLFENGLTTNACSEATKLGAPVYMGDDHTVYDNDNGGTLARAGYFMGLEPDGKVRVLVVPIADPDFDDEAATFPKFLSAKNVVYSNVSLTAYTVAASYNTNDNTANVEGDVILLTAQTTAAENGLYTVGAVTAGAAALTRYGHLPSGLAIVEDTVRVYVELGATFGMSTWANSAAGTVGTDDPAFRFLEGKRFDVRVLRVKQIINGNVTISSGIAVAADANLNDNVAIPDGTAVLLVAQTTAAENGLYMVGVAVAGVAPLYRLAPLTTGTVLGGGAGIRTRIDVAVGDLYGKSTWFDTAAGNSVIGTNSPAHVPEEITQHVTLSSGTVTITNVPIRSATQTGVTITRRTASGTTDTVDYQISAMVAGALGTASLTIQAAVAAGTINTADGSTLKVTIINR